MTDQPSRRARMRALIEDPTWHHPRDIGRELDLDHELRGVPREQIRRFEEAEAAHPGNLLTRKEVVHRPLVLRVDAPRWQAGTGRHVVLALPLSGSGPTADDTELADPRQETP